ncbi:MAG: hypothetical protein RR346_06090 [Bacteroidales bacterium]
MIKTRIFNLVKRFISLIKRYINPDKQSIPDNQIMVFRPNDQSNHEIPILNMYADLIPTIHLLKTISYNPEFIPARHRYATPAAQRRAAKKRQNMRARSHK